MLPALSLNAFFVVKLFALLSAFDPVTIGRIHIVYQNIPHDKNHTFRRLWIIYFIFLLADVYFPLLLHLNL
jgi:hypothetical protein